MKSVVMQVFIVTVIFKNKILSAGGDLFYWVARGFGLWYPIQTRVCSADRRISVDSFLVICGLMTRFRGLPFS